MAILSDLLGNTAEQILDNLTEVGDKYIDLEKIIPAVNDMLTDQASEMRKLNKELGNGSKTTAELRSGFASLSKQLGVTTRDIYDLVYETRQYHQGIKESTSSTLQFIKASGASVDIIGKFSAKLNILGKASKSSFETMYTNILSVRDAYGLTDNQINDIIGSLENYAVITGASTEQIERASITLAKFTSQLTSAGIEADKVSEIVNGMLDPDRMTDNLVLMNKLGVSITDMVSGNPVERLEGATDKLKQLGQEISNIAKTNRIQANEVAKVYGLTLEQANLLANMDTSENALNTQKQLEQYRNEMTTFTESIKYTVTRLSGLISGPLAYIGKIFETFGNTIGMLPRGIGALIVGVTGKKILNKIFDSVGNAAKKWGKNMAESFGSYLSQVENRSKSKEKDIKSLTPNIDKNGNLKYGFGLDYKLRAEQRRNEFNRKRLGPDKTNMTSGEMIESLQDMSKVILDLKKQRAMMAEGSTEAALFDQSYGATIRKFDENFGDLIKSMNDKINQTWGRNFESGENYSKLSKTDKAKYSYGIQDELTEAGIKNASSLGLDNEKVAEIAGITSGPKEFLEKLIEFWKLSDDPESAVYLENTTKALKDFDDEATKSVDSVGKFKESIKEVNEAMNDSTKKMKGRFGSLISGAFTNLGTFIMKAFNPMKLLKGGLLGAAGILGTGIMSSINKNEKFQESVAELKEKVSGLFGTITESLTPIIETVSKWISSALDWLKPKIDAVAGFIGKIASWFGGKVSKSVKNIEDSVAKIEDSYNKEDLKTMVGGVAVYNSGTDELLAKLDDIYYKVVDVTRKQDVAAETSIALGAAAKAN